MKTILQKIKDIRDQFADMFHADPLRKNGTATKEYLDYLEGFMARYDSSCKGCRDYNNGTRKIGCHSCRRYCADLYAEK